MRLAWALATLLLVSPVWAQTGLQTHYPLPQQDANFLPDLQSFLQSEDAARFRDMFLSFVAVGGTFSPVGGLTVTPAALTAYPGGYYITESGSITFGDNKTCWVIASADTASPSVYAGWTRVSGTHYLTDCTHASQPSQPTNTVYIAKVITASGAVSSVTDLRPLSPVTGGGGGGCSPNCVNSLNGLVGDLAIVGTTDRVSVSAVGTTITLSGPQDLAASSSPTFGGLTLTGTLTSTIISATRIATSDQAALTISPWSTSAGNTGEVRFRELAANGTDYVGLKAPDAIATTFVMVLPTGPGTSGQCLSTDGSNPATLSWGACAGGGLGISSLNAQVGATQTFANDTNLQISSAANVHTLTWASTLSSARGGLGLDTSGSTGVPTVAGGTWSVAARLAALRGGTGIDTSGATGIPFIGAGVWSTDPGFTYSVLNGFKMPYMQATPFDDAVGDIVSVTNAAGAQQNASVRKSGRFMVRGANSSASLPAFSFVDDTNTGMYWITGDTLGFSTGGSERARLTSSALTLTTSAIIKGPVPWVDISQYASIQAAHDALPSTGGGMYCPPGTYTTGTVNITKPVKIFGLGGGYSCVIQTSSPGSTIFAVSIDGDNYLVGYQVVFEDVVLENISGTGYGITVTSPSPTLCGSVSLNRVQVNHGGGGLKATNGCFITITNTRFAEYSTIGLDVANAHKPDGGLYYVVNSQICSVQGSAYAVRWVSGSELQIANSEMCGVGGAFILNMDWNVAGGGSYVALTGNVLESGATTAAIRLRNQTNTYFGANVTGNSITNNNGVGIQITGTGGGVQKWKNVLVANNVIRVTNGSSNCMVMQDIDGLLVRDNICDSSAVGISQSNTTNTSVGNNLIY